MVGLAGDAADARGLSLDARLIARAQSGDVDAFDGLLAGRLDRCYRLAWSILEDAADAADATQDACVAAWRDLPRLREPAAFDAWLNRIVANAARSMRRRRGRRREIALPDASDPTGADVPGPVATGDPPEIDQVGEAEVIRRAFDRLTGEQRAILVLHHVEQLPLAMIATSLNVPVGTAKSRLHTARQALDLALRVEA
jgi:RNA polymerase sigma-70 factor (ECF subfamily)